MESTPVMLKVDYLMDFNVGKFGGVGKLRRLSRELQLMGKKGEAKFARQAKKTRGFQARVS
jgi:hypothetical protein